MDNTQQQQQQQQQPSTRIIINLTDANPEHKLDSTAILKDSSNELSFRPSLNSPIDFKFGGSSVNSDRTLSRLQSPTSQHSATTVAADDEVHFKSIGRYVQNNNDVTFISYHKSQINHLKAPCCPKADTIKMMNRTISVN
jgi:hypothetical protein